MIVPALPPLTARSVVLSLLLGTHPSKMSAGELTGAGRHFGIPPATLRVALSRAVAAGELTRADSDYVLGDRLLARQRRQDEAVDEAALPWDGAWEMAVVVVTGRTGPERAALRERLAGLRMAELREGVWTRPANLRRSERAVDPVLSTFRAVPDGEPAALAATLWDLDGWAHEGRDILATLATTTEPARRLSVAAYLVRHLTTDPLLPPALHPAGWPGGDLRAAYADYQRELRDLALA
jgi:phenylacetic acid degradation operon negative regulatory protein